MCASSDRVPRVTPRASKVKADKEIMSEIAAIIRQITASVTFLPILGETCEGWGGVHNFAERGRLGCIAGWESLQPIVKVVFWGDPLRGHSDSRPWRYGWSEMGVDRVMMTTWLPGERQLASND